MSFHASPKLPDHVRATLSDIGNNLTDGAAVAQYLDDLAYSLQYDEPATVITNHRLAEWCDRLAEVALDTKAMLLGEGRSSSPLRLLRSLTCDSNNPFDAAVAERARDNFHRDGELEIDDPTIVSHGGDGTGAYVLAWVWQDYEDREIWEAAIQEGRVPPDAALLELPESVYAQFELTPLQELRDLMEEYGDLTAAQLLAYWPREAPGLAGLVARLEQLREG